MPVWHTPAVAADGDLDTSFGTGGKVTTAIGSGDDYSHSVALQSDGKVVVAGSSWKGSNYDVAVVRYHSNGSLDTSFSTDGKVTTAIGSSDGIGNSAALQSDGKVVVAGYSYNSTNSDVAVVRYHSNGTLDTSFSTDGKVTTDFGSSHDYGFSVALQSDGKVVVAGYSDNGGNNDVAVVRYNSNGTLDTSFDTDGKVTTAIGSGDDSGISVALQSDGKVVVAGYSYNGSKYDVAVVRYHSNGTLDTSFGTDGKVTTAIGSGDDYGISVALQSDGKVVVAGYSYNGSKYDVAVVRYHSNGTLDTTFDTDGKVTTAIGSGDDSGISVALQSDGKVVVAGYSYNGSKYDVAVVRYHSNGTLDTSFGTDGKVTTAIGSGDDYGISVALQSDGKVVVAGYSLIGSNNDVAVVRYLGTLNNAPVATADSYNTTENTMLTAAATGVLANDTDADNNPLTATLGTTVSHGSLTLNADGSLVYTPTANWSGMDSFTYFANDGTVNSTAAVTVTIIVKKALIATANDVSRVYGDATPTFNFTYSGGWVGTDTAAVLDTLPTATSTATTTSNVGTYPITCTNGSDNNYALTCVNGTLTITPATQTISYTGPTTATYGDTPLALSASVLGGGSGNDRTFTSSPASVCTTGGTNGATLTVVSAGTCTVTANQAGNVDYHAAATVTQNITINAKPVTPLLVTSPPVVIPPPVTSIATTPSLPDQWSLFLQVDGTGHGKVTTDTGLSCHSTDCQTNEVGELKCNSSACTQLEKTVSYVTLTPQADPDSIFSSWGGHEDCVDGQVFMNSNKLCIAYFHRSYDLTVMLEGSGAVMGYGWDQQPMGLDCGNQCKAAYDSGTMVYLQATPGEGMIFSGWSGDCQGTQNPLPVTVTNDLTCQAHFLSEVVPSIPAEASTPEVSTPEVSTPVVPSIPAEASTPEVSSPEVSSPEVSTSVVPSIPAEASTPVVPSIPAEASTPVASTPVVPLIPAEASTPAAEASTPVVPSIPAEASTPEVSTPVVPVIPIQPPILGDASFSCETTGSINQVCNYGGRAVTELDIQSQGMVSNGVLYKNLVNLGWVSNFHITANAKLTGGVVTGYLKNEGLMRDFDFKGMSIIGGTLGGVITNTSKVGGFFQDVTLLAGTKITGGTLKGTIKGDKKSPAVLEKVRVKKGSKLSGVKLGKDVKLEKGVVVE